MYALFFINVKRVYSNCVLHERINTNASFKNKFIPIMLPLPFQHIYTVSKHVSKYKNTNLWHLTSMKTNEHIYYFCYGQCSISFQKPKRLVSKYLITQQLFEMIMEFEQHSYIPRFHIK